MSDVARYNPVGRFTGLAVLYAKCRPSYPGSAIDFVVSRCGLRPGSLLVDVGAGTGIASRLFAAKGIPVLGIEPNPDMRREAQAQSFPKRLPPPRYIEGRSEATGLPAGCADTVLAAQAFHWFDPEPALAEFHRILKPSGWVALLWNDRDASDPFTAAYGELIRRLPDSAAADLCGECASAALYSSPYFEGVECRPFQNEQALAEEEFVGRAFSASYAPRAAALAQAYEESLRGLFSKYQRGGRVALRYQTPVFLGRRSNTELNSPAKPETIECQRQ